MGERRERERGERERFISIYHFTSCTICPWCLLFIDRYFCFIRSSICLFSSLSKYCSKYSPHSSFFLLEALFFSGGINWPVRLFTVATDTQVRKTRPMLIFILSPFTPSFRCLKYVFS